MKFRICHPYLDLSRLSYVNINGQNPKIWIINSCLVLKWVPVVLVVQINIKLFNYDNNFIDAY